MVPIDFNSPLRWGGGGEFNRDFDVLLKSKHYSKRLEIFPWFVKFDWAKDLGRITKRGHQLLSHFLISLSPSEHPLLLYDVLLATLQQLLRVSHVTAARRPPELLFPGTVGMCPVLICGAEQSTAQLPYKYIHGVGG